MNKIYLLFKCLKFIFATMLIVNPLVSFAGQTNMTSEWKYNGYLVNTNMKPNDRAYPPRPLVIRRNKHKDTATAFAGWDLVYPAKLSCNNDRLICIVSVPLTFAVPKQFPKVPDNWNAGNFQFRLFSTKPIPLEILGQKIDVWLIKARDPHDPRYEFEYFYSPKRGLVAYALVRRGVGGEGSVAWVVGQCGFAARDCHQEQGGSQ